MCGLSQLRVGQAVEGNFNGEGAWYPGTVARLHRDGSCEVNYTDGDHEERVVTANLRLPQGTLAEEGNAGNPRFGRHSTLLHCIYRMTP
jgi:hypothetical protein